MKKIQILIALLACTGFMSAQEAVPSVPAATLQPAEAPQTVAATFKFGYLSYNEIIHAMPEYAQALKSLEELEIFCDSFFKENYNISISDIDEADTSDEEGGVNNA